LAAVVGNAVVVMKLPFLVGDNCETGAGRPP
jgi:hypothetical protein